MCILLFDIFIGIEVIDYNWNAALIYSMYVFSKPLKNIKTAGLAVK